MSDHEGMEQSAEEMPAPKPPPKRFLFTRVEVTNIFVEGAEDAVQAYEAALEGWRHSEEKTGITVRSTQESNTLSPKPFSSETPQLGMNFGNQMARMPR